MTWTIGELCAGTGMLGLAVASVLGDARMAWVADNDPDACAVLRERFPGVPNLGDITAVDWRDVEPVDVIAAGFPCTDISNAGRRAGIAGPRSGVWRDIARAIGVLRPKVVCLENVGAVLVRGGVRVVADLAEHRYVGSAGTLRASTVGAPHRRERWFAVAVDPDRAAIHPPAAITAEPELNHKLLATPVARDWKGKGKKHQLLCLLRSLQGGGVDPALLPTPCASDGGSGGETRRAGGPRLDSVVALLPTPTANAGDDNHRGLSVDTALRRRDAGRRMLDDAVALLPTPRGSEGAKGGPNQRGSSGDLTLTSSVMLLPAPTVSNHAGNGYNSRGEPLLPGAVADADRWGQYGPAIRRWETLLGRPAPEPIVAGRRGGRRLSARFVEWLMGWPAGWVSDIVPNTPALKLCGNGVVPRQAAEAYRRLGLGQ